MDVLILGASSIVLRRVLPALRSLVRVEGVSVLSRRVDAALPADVLRLDPAPLERVLERPRALVYVSLENGAHDRAGWSAVTHGHDVVLDKPAFLRADVRREAVARARADGLLLAESLVWSHHPQVAVAREVIGGRTVRSVTSTFTFPDFPPGSFRHRTASGGGALSDLGPYAATAARALLGRDPDGVAADVHRRGPDGLELSFSVRETYGDAVHLGYYGFGSEYANRIDIAGDGFLVTLEPAFTTRADQRVDLRIRERDEVRTLGLDPSDTFRTFLSDVVAAAEGGDRSPHLDALVADGAAFDRLSDRLGVDWARRVPRL